MANIVKLEIDKRDPIVINVYSKLDVGFILIRSSKPRFVEGVWYVDLEIAHTDNPLKLVDGNGLKPVKPAG